MGAEQLEEIKEKFSSLIEGENETLFKEFLNEQNISDVAELVEEFPDYATRIISSMLLHRAVNVFRIIDVETQKKIIQTLPSDNTAALLNELPPDDRTSFLEELPSAVERELIKLLDPEERKITLGLLGYPENSVGRLMTPDYVYVYENNTVAEVIETIRMVGKSSETIDVIYVISESGDLLDDIKIREFILADPNTKVSSMMDRRFIALNAYDDQEEAHKIFKVNNRTALPVVNQKNKLLGIVTIDDILWVATEEFSEDMQKIGGTQALDMPYLSIPILQLFKKRVGWLVILFLGEMLTATAMAYFEDEIAKAVVLALFVPLIISSGGNSGSQASTLIIQAMAIGEITIRDWWNVLRREIISGLLLGSVLGIVGFFRIFIWNSINPQLYGQYWLEIAFTVGFALMGVVLWGTPAGSMLPLILKKLGADPATSSAPFVATLVDVTGLIIYFSLAFFTLSGKLL